MELSFDHINGENWKLFENLTKSYFDIIQRDENTLTTIKSIDTFKSGSGVDRGLDILVTFRMSDSISEFENKWVIQCKCYSGDVRPSDIYDINIPSLVHKHDAVGYLLICKGDFTSGISDLFKGLNESCRLGYKYKVWCGDDFINKIHNLGWDNSFVKQFFNEYYNFSKEMGDRITKNEEKIIKDSNS